MLEVKILTKMLTIVGATVLRLFPFLQTDEKIGNTLMSASCQLALLSGSKQGKQRAWLCLDVTKSTSTYKAH